VNTTDVKSSHVRARRE